MINFDLKKVDNFYNITLKTDYTEIGTFHRMTGVIFSLGWDVVSGELNTIIENGLPFSQNFLKLRSTKNNSSQEVMDIGILMDSIFSQKMNFEELVKKYNIRMPPVETFFGKQGELIFQDDQDKQATCFYLEADSREGLLFHITKVFLDFKINILSAIIETDLLTQRAMDTFYLVDEDGKMFGDKPIANQIREKILYTCD